MPGLAMWWPFTPAPPTSPYARAPTPRVLQRWLLSPASRPDAGSAPGHGKCSAHDRQRSPSTVLVNARGLDFPPHRIGVYSRASGFGRSGDTQVR